MFKLVWLAIAAAIIVTVIVPAVIVLYVNLIARLGGL